MRNHRNAFFLALSLGLVLAGFAAGVWWNARRAATAQQSAASTSNAPAQPAAERLQSIGVKFGVVERKPVHDEIRATGTIAIDETRLSYVQTRFSGYIQKVFADAT